MDLTPTPIWERWSAGGPFLGTDRANARVTIDANWYLEKDDAAFIRGRGTWWRDDPATLTDFATASSWMVDSRKRRGVRSFQRVRNGEWTYWGASGTSGTIATPTGSMTRAAMAVYLKGVADSERVADPTLPALPAYDGTPDYTDLAGQPGSVVSAVGQLTQAGVIGGFPDGTFKPDVEVTAAQKVAFIERLKDFLWGTAGGAKAVELPNVKLVTWDRSIDTDAGECTITVANIRMRGNNDPQPDLSELGLPGYYGPNRGSSMDGTARWPNHTINEWSGKLLPNAIVRTYEGYGGTDLTIKAAVEAGYLYPTGTWMIDRVRVGSDGVMTLECRDMARLLLEQQLYPPIVPTAVYPLRYARYLTTETGEKRTGNMLDWSDIIYDLLLWAGFYYDVHPPGAYPDIGGGPPPAPGTEGFAQVHGVLETTGAWPEETVPDELLDKRPIIDAINEIKAITGYVFYVDGMGRAHYRSPNWWGPGNFTDDMTHTDVVPEIDERVQLTAFSGQLSGESLRTQIVIASEAVPPVPPYGSTADAYAAYRDAISRSTWYTPPLGREMWHGMEIPAMWVNGAFTDPAEQETMAELIALHIYYRSRQSSVTMWGNPCIGINDQVRPLERNNDETYIHYVRGVNSSLDNNTGRYTMTLTTHWLGDGEHWTSDLFSLSDVVRTRIAEATGQLTGGS